jgi:pimeloyl-ACP methyl ester carboxylesterase
MIEVSAGRWKMATIDRRGGERIVLVHGFPLDHSLWQAQIDALSGRFRVIAPDLVGFGDSPPPEGPMSMDAHAESLAVLLDSLGVQEPVTCCGLSMGGYILWRFVANFRHRVKRLIQCDTRSIADDDAMRRVRGSLAARVRMEGPAVLLEAMLPKLLGSTSHASRPDVVEQVRRMVMRVSPEGAAAALEAMAERPDARSLLRTLDVPTLIVCGAQDVISTPDEMRAIAGAIHGARFAEIPDAGHLAPLENPPSFNAAVEAFLGDTREG